MAEAGWVDGVGGAERLDALGTYVLCGFVVDGGGSMIANSRVPVVIVVVVEESLAESPGILDRAEVLRECRAVLQGLELALAVRVVVGLTG